MRAANRLSVTAVLFLAVSVAAQVRPDFSGRWTAEPAATASGAEQGSTERARGVERRNDPAPRGDMGSGWGSAITIKQNASRLTVEYAFFARGDMQPPLKFVYALDGTETRNTVMMGRGIQVQTSKTAWDGDKLVITTLHAFQHPATGQPMTSEVKHTLSLESPTALIVETVRSGVSGGPSSTTRTAYTRTND
ncbi:MAG TPA: hypothetical protein VFV34_04370 [Blastocatellia bacterium]|nr:hypothetical protein [Blastocatellia bacterium]